MAVKKTETTKTYICDLKNGKGTRKITVPATWKLTFGSVLPYEKGSPYREGSDRIALRFYEGSKENLRAVFTDVASIRDESIKIIEKRTTTKRQAMQKNGPNGAKEVMVEASVTEWVDPDHEEADTVPTEFLRLPKTSETDDF